MMSSPDSTSIMLSPISPSPPSGIRRTAGSAGVSIGSGSGRYAVLTAALVSYHPPPRGPKTGGAGPPRPERGVVGWRRGDRREANPRLRRLRGHSPRRQALGAARRRRSRDPRPVAPPPVVVEEAPAPARGLLRGPGPGPRLQRPDRRDPHTARRRAAGPGRGHEPRADLGPGDRGRAHSPGRGALTLHLTYDRAT